MYEALQVYRAASYGYGIGQSHALLGRVAARQGRYAEADGHFADPRDAFVSAELDADVLELDGRVAERLALEQRGAEALTLATDTLRVMRVQGLASELPLLQRVRGCALLQLGRRAEAREALVDSLELARSTESGYEIAMSLIALAADADLAGDDEQRGATAPKASSGSTSWASNACRPCRRARRREADLEAIDGARTVAGQAGDTEAECARARPTHTLLGRSSCRATRLAAPAVGSSTP